MDILYLVIPCYNEEAVLDETKKRLEKKMKELMKAKKINKYSKVVFVNDGSKDKTWEKILKFHESNSMFSGVNLSRNRGHQNALLAGLMTVKNDADMVISMDADLQDDIDVIDQFIEEYKKGNDVVYGVRSSRKKDTFFKRNTALMFYRIMEKMGVQIIYNHADYRLMSKRALEALSEFKEVNLFLRGMVPLIGFSYTTVLYERAERFAGESKYPLKKMLAFAFDGITSFSIKPIRFFLFLGIFIFFCSLIILIYALIRYINVAVIWGWTSLMVSIWALGGLQLFAIGVIGEYIGKVYMETKQRPRFIVETYLK